MPWILTDEDERDEAAIELARARHQLEHMSKSTVFEPEWEQARRRVKQRIAELERAAEGFDAMVDRFMYCDGLDRQEAEAKALNILQDDGA